MDRNSLEELADFGRAASRVRLIRRYGGWVLGIAFGCAVSWIRGWNDSISRVEDVSELGRRVGAIERFAADAGVAIDALKKKTAATDKAGALTAGRVDTVVEADKLRDIAYYRTVVLSNVSAPRADAAVKQYDRLIRQKVDPYVAMDITLGWSKLPGR